jgi:asparagine synthase (glutamine-hydrolysing)
MCGIAGQIGITSDAHVDVGLVPATAALLAHRGPDGWGYTVDPAGQVLLLNTRLAVVDVVGGRQPMCNEDGQVWVTLNGECYGFEHQRRWLESRGHRFRTRTDTEVLVHLYEECGEGFVERLRGEYAFALHDRRRGVCLLVRDRFGIKPLVFTEHRGRLVFASEAKALFADETIDRALDREHVLHAVCGIFLPQRTFFKGVHHVEPGAFLRVEVGRGWTSVRYWNVPFRRDGHEVPSPVLPDGHGAADRRDADAIQAFGDKLREATRARLHGDVQVGAYLSGGVDSAAVLNAIRESASSAPAFTVGFEDGRFDETAAAALVAQHLGAPHHVVRIASAQLGEAFVAAEWHSETPVINAHGAAKFVLSRLASTHVKVVLTGEGADELLAGYPQFRHQQLIEACRQSPRDREAATLLKRFIATNTGAAGVTPFERYPRYEQVVARLGAYPYAAARMFALQPKIRWLLSPECRRTMAGFDTLGSLEGAMGTRAFAGLDPISASQAVLFRTQLPGYIFVNLGDRQEMAHGVEGRTPFLDHELVELGCALPMRLKLAAHRNKHVLRRLLEGVLPAASVRPKNIFLAPSTRALGLDGSASSLEEWLLPRAVREAGVFSPTAVAMLRRIVRHAPHGTRSSSMAEAALVFALSVSVLEALFCRGFAAARARHSPDPARFDLASGVIGAAMTR